jgi:hypothetical protein
MQVKFGDLAAKINIAGHHLVQKSQQARVANLLL